MYFRKWQSLNYERKHPCVVIEDKRNMKTWAVSNFKYNERFEQYYSTQYAK